MIREGQRLLWYTIARELSNTQVSLLPVDAGWGLTCVFLVETGEGRTIQ